MFVFVYSSYHLKLSRICRKNIPIKSSHPKKYLSNFPLSYPKKIPEEKNSNPEKILRSPPSLEIQSTPSPNGDKGTQECLIPSEKLKGIPLTVGFGKKLETVFILVIRVSRWR